VRDPSLLVVGMALLVAGIVGLVLLGFGVLGPRVAADSPTVRGAWIFQTGTDVDGRPISFAGGMMMRMSCASCHEADGHGLRAPMFISPDIAYRNLTDPRGMVEPDGSRDGVYSDPTLKRAVTEGVDAPGNSLAWPMPRWRLTDRQWQDLLAYLRTLP